MQLSSWFFCSWICHCSFLSEYECSKENICSGHGECKDNSWCLCRPGWSSKDDCSGSLFFMKRYHFKQLSNFDSIKEWALILKIRDHPQKMPPHFSKFLTPLPPPVSLFKLWKSPQFAIFHTPLPPPLRHLLWMVPNAFACHPEGPRFEFWKNQHNNEKS